MPDVNINPNVINSRAESAAPNGKDGTPGPSKPPPLTTSTSQKGNKPAQVLPRVDIEPLYTSLKNGIGDNWVVYKDGVSRFILGRHLLPPPKSPTIRTWPCRCKAPGPY